MFKKFFACITVFLLLVSNASADSSLLSCHASITDIVGGRPDYSCARFYSLSLSLLNDGEEFSLFGVSGAMTITGGSYSFWDGMKMQDISGGSRIFVLKEAESQDYGEGLTEYVPIASGDRRAVFVNDADGGLKGANVRWYFPSAPMTVLSGRIPDYLTTEEQLASCVPYFEYVYSGDKVSGLEWRIIRSDDVMSPVPQSGDIEARISVYRKNYGGLYSGAWTGINAGEYPEGTVFFDELVDEADIWLAVIDYREDDAGLYQWRYVSQPEASPETWIADTSYALLRDGKADFSTAGSLGAKAEVYGSNILAEAKYFTDEGTITISSIEGEPDMTLRLLPVPSMELGSSYIDYKPVSEDGSIMNFSAEEISGKIIAWKFPESLSLDGAYAVPEYKSLNEQLAEGAPYIEIIRDGSSVSEIRFMLAVSDDVSKPVSSDKRTDFYLRTFTSSGNDYYSGWQENMNAGIWKFNEPVAYNDLKGVSARVRIHDASEDVNASEITVPIENTAPITINMPNFPVYQWDFAREERYLAEMAQTMNEMGEAFTLAMEAEFTALVAITEVVALSLMPIAAIGAVAEEAVKIGTITAIAVGGGLAIGAVYGYLSQREARNAVEEEEELAGCNYGIGYTALACVPLMFRKRRKS